MKLLALLRKIKAFTNKITSVVKNINFNSISICI
jgi:hypothetical protein